MQQGWEVVKVAPNPFPLIHPMFRTMCHWGTAYKVARPTNTLIPTTNAKSAATGTNATVKLKSYANRAPIAQSQSKLSVQPGHTVSIKAKQQSRHALHVPRVLINRVKDLNIALSGKFVSV
jgi:hypothetical protein